MVPVELTRFGSAHRGQNAFRIPAEKGTVRHVGQTCDRKGSRPHRGREVAVGRRFRRDPALAAMSVDINGDGVAQDVECGRGGLGRPGGSCRTPRSNIAGEHSGDRSRSLAPHPVARCEGVALTTAIHAVLQKGGLPLIIGVPAHSNILSHSEGRYPWQDWVLTPAGKTRKGITPPSSGCISAPATS